jgi:endonuclease/exonuclease/phosphatase (EEP) superfamily protein YafD
MIFLPSKLYHKKRDENAEQVFTDTFTLMCWNVHKNNIAQNKFASFISQLATRYSLSLVLLQEANIASSSCLFPSLSYDAAANLQVGGRFFGVLTASRVESLSASASLSRHTEGLVATRKSMLVTTYLLSTHDRLMVINVHAINFRGDKAYSNEIEELIAQASRHEGALIIAGDFNAWNKKRTKTLRMMEEKLSLDRVVFEPSRPKSFRGYPLDFVFYRGICLKEADIISRQMISDHHPLLVTFGSCG